MKKILLVVIPALSFSVASVSFAANTGPGCGFGSQLFDNKAGLASHVLAATTNGSSGNQTFGMSSGTLGCDINKAINYQTSLYMDKNIDKVAANFAAGEGEALVSLASLLGIPNEQVSEFGELVRENFTAIFNEDNISSAQALENLIVVLKGDDQFATYVS